MTGVYTDNQPDFTWLKPMEEKRFTQYFMPYKTIGAVKNASIEAMVATDADESEIRVAAYTTQEYPDARVILTYEGQVLLDEKRMISPVAPFETHLDQVVEDETKLTVCVLDGTREMISYTPAKKEIPSGSGSGGRQRKIRRRSCQTKSCS